jgi:AraC-like DNA-binding protein
MHLKSVLLFLFSVCLFGTQTLQAQKPTTSDSLLKIIPGLTDTVKLEAMRQLIYANNITNKAIVYARMLLKEAQKQKSVYYQSFALGKLTELYYPQFNNDSVFIWGKASEEFDRTHQFYKHYFIVGNIVVQRYTDQGYNTLAFNKAQQLYEQAQKLNNPLPLYSSLSTMANVYYQLEYNKQAIQVEKEAVQLLKGLKDLDYAKLIESYKYLAAFSYNIKDYNATVLYSDTMILYCNKLKQEGSFRDINEYLFFAYGFKSSGYSQNNQSQLAYENLLMTKSLLNDNWPATHVDFYNQVQLNYYKGIGDYNRALQYSDLCIKFAFNEKLSSYIKTSLLVRARIFQSMGNYKEATNTFDRYTQVSDSLLDQNFSRQINELKTIYNLDKAELSAEQSRSKLRVTRIISIASTLICLLLAAFAIFIVRKRNQLEQKNRLLFQRITEQDQLVSELNQKESEYNRLQSLVKPNASIKATDTDDELFLRLKELMEKEKLYTSPDLSRKTLSEKLNTNEMYLIDSIKKNFNLTFNDYVNLLRLEHARNLLSDSNSNITIEGVALDSGFGSRNTFYRLFRERYGLTPAEFKRLATEHFQ